MHKQHIFSQIYLCHLVDHGPGSPAKEDRRNNCNGYLISVT